MAVLLLVVLLLGHALPGDSAGVYPSTRERQHHVSQGHHLRRPKAGEENTIRVVDVSADVDNMKDGDGKFTHVAWTKENLPPAFTICTAFMVETWSPTSTGATLFQLNGADGFGWGDVTIYPYNTFSTFNVMLAGNRFSASGKGPLLFPQQWTRACLSVDSGSGKVLLVVDGRLLDERVHGIKDTPSNLHLVIGYTEDKWGFAEEYPGKSTNLNVFSAALSAEGMVRLTSADGEECGAPGDYLSWEDAEWELHSQAKLDTMLAIEGPCRATSKLHVFTAVMFNTDCMQLCQKLGKGRVASVLTAQDWQNFTEEVSSVTPDISVLPWLWLPLKEGEPGSLASLAHWPEGTETRETVWRDYYTGTQIEAYTHPWYGGSDNRKGPMDNCMLMYTDTPFEESWGELHCVYKYACPCTYKEPPTLILRGLCPASSLWTKDKKFGIAYTPRQLPSTPNDLFLVGGFSTQIRYDDNSGMWILTDAVSSVTAVSRASKGSYVLGKHSWTITNDVYGCHEGKEYTTQLKLTGCSEGQFTCDDGQCVQMEERCDQVPDCRDKSDEDGCQLLMLEKSYNKLVPPITTVSVMNKTIVPVPVKVSIALLKIVSMEERQHAIDIQFEIALKWNENRATYLNLKHDSSLNAMTNNDVWLLWLPRLIYDNTDQKQTTRLGERSEWSTIVTVARGESFTRSGTGAVDEIEIFKGEDSTLTMVQTYTHRFQCQYMLHRYPFDTQECTIEMTMGTLDLRTVSLLPDQLQMKERVEMTLYTISKWTLVHRNNENKEEGVRMTVTMQRKIMNELMTTYLPSILLMLITYSTTFFKPYFFEAALTVNLTTMLVMTTIFISVMQMLPATAYVKMVDVWLIFGQLVPFLEVVLLTLMEFFRTGDGTGHHTRTINHHGEDRVIDLTLYENEDGTNDKKEIESVVVEDNQSYQSSTSEDSVSPAHMAIINKFVVIEEKVLPGVVVIFTLIYVIICVAFYTHMI